MHARMTKTMLSQRALVAPLCALLLLAAAAIGSCAPRLDYVDNNHLGDERTARATDASYLYVYPYGGGDRGSWGGGDRFYVRGSGGRDVIALLRWGTPRDDPYASSVTVTKCIDDAVHLERQSSVTLGGQHWQDAAGYTFPVGSGPYERHQIYSPWTVTRQVRLQPDTLYYLDLRQHLSAGFRDGGPCDLPRIAAIESAVDVELTLLAVVPEPATVTLLLVGATLAAGARFSRRLRRASDASSASTVRR
jgi:hypothetical protein